MSTDPDRLTGIVKETARRVGFDLVGISSAEPLAEAGRRLVQAVRKGCTAGMAYLERDPSARSKPRSLAPWARSIICLGVNYHFLPLSGPTGRHQVPLSRYALGQDYHLVLGEKLELFRAELQEVSQLEFRSRIAVDTSPLLEKPLAQRAGLGWQGKHTLLINKKFGSWFFLGEVLTDLELTPDSPAANQCGSCTACIEACPTGALSEAGLLDARKCLSYLTIEHRGEFPLGILDKIKAHQTKGPKRSSLCLYGCDICQEVCPFNRGTPGTSQKQFHPRPELLYLRFEELNQMSEPQFKQTFSGTALARLSYEQFCRNLQALKLVLV